MASTLAGYKNRKPRTKVMLPSRMKLGTQWVDACIHNVSRRGLMATSDHAPNPGSYVEIRRGRNVIIGRAVWRKGTLFGMQTQDDVDLPALREDPRIAGRRNRGDDEAAVERRGADRLKEEAALARARERSETFARIVQFVVVAAIGIGIAAFAANMVYGVISGVGTHVQRALSGEE